MVVPTLLAYLDPGTGSMVFQIVLASLFSGMVFFRSSLRMFKERLAAVLK